MRDDDLQEVANGLSAIVRFSGCIVLLIFSAGALVGCTIGVLLQ